jgi:hypothetical protein
MPSPPGIWLAGARGGTDRSRSSRGVTAQPDDSDRLEPFILADGFYQVAKQCRHCVEDRDAAGAEFPLHPHRSEISRRKDVQRRAIEERAENIVDTHDGGRRINQSEAIFG